MSETSGISPDVAAQIAIYKQLSKDTAALQLASANSQATIARSTATMEVSKAAADAEVRAGSNVADLRA